jgi:peroxiredoxin
MKNYILCVIFVLVAVCVKAQDITVLQINAKWNEKNNYDLSDLNGVIVKFSYLKDQPKDIQKGITAVPVIVIIDKTGRVRMQYVADLSFKINVSNMEIQNTINKIKGNRRSSTN